MYDGDVGRFTAGLVILATAAAGLVALACSSFSADGKNDSATVGDAGRVTTPDGASAPSFCATVDAAALVLCDDFDDRFDAAPWRPERGDPQAAYQITADASTSPPSSLEAVIAPGPDPSPDARYRFELPGSPKHIVVSGMLRVPTRELNAGGVHVAMIQVGDIGGVFLNLNGDVAEVVIQDGGREFQSSPGVGVVPADWTSFTLAVDLTIPAASLRLGDKALGRVPLDTSKAAIEAFTPSIYLGIWEGKASSQVGFVAQFDDVAIRAY